MSGQANDFDYVLVIDKGALLGRSSKTGEAAVAQDAPDQQSVLIGQGSDLGFKSSEKSKQGEAFCPEAPRIGRITFGVDFDPVRAKQPFGQYLEALAVILRVCLGSIHCVRLIRILVASKDCPTPAEKAEVVA